VEFYKILQSSLQQKHDQEEIIAQTICKTSQSDNQDLDRLMELGSRRLVMKDQDCNIAIVMKRSGRLGDTKKDKKVLKKISKI
jgi:hypothetical protein